MPKRGVPPPQLADPATASRAASSVGERPLRGRPQRPARLGQRRGPALPALEERHAQLGLQPAHLLRQRGLRQVQGPAAAENEPCSAAARK